MTRRHGDTEREQAFPLQLKPVDMASTENGEEIQGEDVRGDQSISKNSILFLMVPLRSDASLSAFCA